MYQGSAGVLLLFHHHFKSLFRETFEFGFWCSRSQSDIPLATKAELVGREGSFILISSKFLDKISQTKIEFIMSLGWDTVLFCISTSWCRLGWLYWCIVTYTLTWCSFNADSLFRTQAVSHLQSHFKTFSLGHNTQSTDQHGPIANTRTEIQYPAYENKGLASCSMRLCLSTVTLWAKC